MRGIGPRGEVRADDDQQGENKMIKEDVKTQDVLEKFTVRAAPANTADKGKVRYGGESPSFGPIRASVQ
jgi:hypothetical protein